MSHITKIEVYPQVFLYEKEYLDNRLGGSIINAIKGRFFGFITGVDPKFDDSSMNPLSPHPKALKFEVFSGEDYSPSIDIAITYQRFVEKFLFDSEVKTVIGDNYYRLSPDTSLDWKELKISCSDGEHYFVVPAPSNRNILLPIRVRFFYAITYMSGEQEILMTFPHQVDGFYETVFNADQPYRFIVADIGDGIEKEYAKNEWTVFDVDGNEITPVAGTNPLYYEITTGSNGAYLLMKESVIGCYDNELMRQKAMISSRVTNSQSVMEEVKPSDYERLPEAVQALIVPDWTFAYNTGDAKPTDGQNVYDIKSSFIRRRCYFIPYISAVRPLISAKFIDARTSEEYPVNGLIDATIDFTSEEPIVSMNETVFASLSDAIHSIRTIIDCSGTIVDFREIQRTLSFTLLSRGSSNIWSVRTVSAGPVPPEPFDVVAGTNYSDEIFESIQKSDLETMCGLSEGSTTAWIGKVLVSYTGTFDDAPLTITQEFYFMLGIDSCVSISSASASIMGGVWKNTSLKMVIGMPSIFPSTIKSQLLSKLFIPSNGLSLVYSGALAGIVRSSVSPEKQFTSSFANISYGLNIATIDFSGTLSIQNDVGSPISLSNGTAFIHSTIKDNQSNSAEIVYGVEIPITGGDMNYTVSNPPDISEIDPKVESLISQI